MVVVVREVEINDIKIVDDLRDVHVRPVLVIVTKIVVEVLLDLDLVIHLVLDIIADLLVLVLVLEMLETDTIHVIMVDAVAPVAVAV